MARDQAVREQAAAWAVRSGDPAFDDWDGFTAWLEQDPAHAFDGVLVEGNDLGHDASPW